MNMQTVKVKNMQSDRSGRSVANQFIVETANGDYFQSYDSMIAFRSNTGKVTLDEHYWNYSVTTEKYRNQFLGEDIAETRKKIASGDYDLADLNRSGMVANFECNGECDICEAAHVAILSAMYRDVQVPAAASEWEAWMDVQVSLIANVFEPYQGGYRIYRSSGHIAIDRKENFPVKALAGKRLGVIGLR